MKATRFWMCLLAGAASLWPVSSAWGEAKWVNLFNGKDVAGWKALDPAQNEWRTAAAVKPDPAEETRFAMTDGEGVLVNGPRGSTSNIYTEHEHGDCELHVEFVVPKGSNSGVYLMGLYEIQVLDSYGKTEVEYSDCGGIYGQWTEEKGTFNGRPPMVNASRPPGEWQSYDIIFRAPRFDEQGNKIENARFVRVMHNGQLVHQQVELQGPTRASLPGPEKPMGPLMLQGDHGPVAYRNIRVRPLKDAGGVAWFNGKDLTGWRPVKTDRNDWRVAGEVRMDPEDNKKLVITDGEGLLCNGVTGKTGHLVSEREHGDAEIYVEFLVPAGSNSGIYLMGKYELQILDSFGKKEVTYVDCGAVYARYEASRGEFEGHAPRVNASRPPGQWQTYEIAFRAPRFDKDGQKVENARLLRVLHNGLLIHENLELTGPTRAPTPGPEGPRGPLLLQGDHGPVAFRNFYICDLSE